MNEPEWTGDLDGDCTASWNGFVLRAERMEDGLWWWGVYDAATDAHLMSSNGLLPKIFPTGEAARAAALEEAHKHLK